jgi:hypothetical protein
MVANLPSSVALADTHDPDYYCVGAQYGFALIKSDQSVTYTHLSDGVLDGVQRMGFFVRLIA